MRCAQLRAMRFDLLKVTQTTKQTDRETFKWTEPNWGPSVPSFWDNCLYVTTIISENNCSTEALPPPKYLLH